MADAVPSFEQKDTEGETIHLNGAVGLTAVPVPSPAGGIIDEVQIECMETNGIGEDLLVSFDGGTNFKRLLPGDSWTWTPKGNVSQFYIKGAAASVAYEAVVNREA